jgi:hypothetical protein
MRFIPNDNDSSISKETSIFGGSGKFGSFGNGTDVGIKLNFGIVTSIHKFILEKSKNMLGILNGGISNTGKLSRLHVAQILQFNWSYSSVVQVPHFSDQFFEISIIA